MKDNISDNLKAIMIRIGRAIAKAVGEDIRNYIATNENVTNNALPFLRGDYIHTNIKKALENREAELKFFNRSFWKGIVIIDREDQISISVCSQNTLNRISKNINHKSPHYMQTILNVENKNEIASIKQMSIADLDPSFDCGFSDEDYEKDFFAIMEVSPAMFENYRHWVVSYEAEHYQLAKLSATLFDRNFNVVQELSLLETLKPDFGELTASDIKNKKQDDVHNLVSVKAGLVGRKASEPEKRTEILPKSVEESKEA
ncbi:MAG: hypothetical protein KHY46_05345 [Clostridiales bacterium]|nr:hypothetical protein [Clostridiales bacterium]